MAGNAINRELVRDYLATLLTAKLGPLGEDVTEAVYGYKIGDFDNQSPVVTVISAGSQRDRSKRGSEKWDTKFFLTVFVFVVYAVEGTDFGEDDAEDALDLIEKHVSDAMMDSRSQAQDASAPWDTITFSGRSDATADVVVGGKNYRREIIDVEARIVSG